MGEHDNGGALNDEQRGALRDPTTEAMRERNNLADKMSNMLGEIWKLCGGLDKETALQAAQRIVTGRNGTISAIAEQRDNARAELDIARRKLEEYKRASTVVPTIAAEYKTAKEELEATRSQLAEVTRQRNNAQDDWRAQRERAREVVEVLADYAIERVKLKRQLELEAQQHEAQWEGDKERLRIQEAKIAKLEREAAQRSPGMLIEFERLEADNKRLRDQDAILRGQLDHANGPSKELLASAALCDEFEAAVQPVLDALASWSAPFAASMAHGVTEGEAANLAHLTLALHKTHKTFAEWCEARTSDDDIPF